MQGALAVDGSSEVTALSDLSLTTNSDEKDAMYAEATRYKEVETSIPETTSLAFSPTLFPRRESPRPSTSVLFRQCRSGVEVH